MQFQKTFQFSIVHGQNGMCAETRASQKFCENLTIYYRSWMLFHEVKVVQISSYQRVALPVYASRDPHVRVNFLLAAIFVMHTLQNSILPYVEKMLSPNTDTIGFKLHEVDGFDLGMVEQADRCRTISFLLHNL